MTKKSTPYLLLAAFLISLSIIAPSHAGLPAAVGGQPLPTLAPLLERITPAVVNIATEGRVVVQNPLLDDPFFRRFFDVPSQPKQERRRQGLGSGVIIDAKNGYIVTNHHVIDKAEGITVTLHDGRQLEAKVIGDDPEADIAVIQIKADNLTDIPLADSNKMRVGDFVVAIGNPFGLGQTVTSGIISALGRSGLGIESYEDFIQTDASINPGNSGGALVNLSGELVGINTAILGPSGGNIGIGFAIPANMAESITEQLIANGEVRRGRLGITVQDLTPDLAEAFNIKQTQGVAIARVEKGSPAEKADLKPGDVIIAVDGLPVRNSASIRNAIGLLRIGSKVQMKVLRNGKTFDLDAVVAEQEVTSVDGQKLSPQLTGASLGNIKDKDDSQQGVQVLDLQNGTPAAQSGLIKGDIIMSVNRQIVNNIDELRSAIGNNPRELLLNIQRGNGALFLLMR